jgi:site-specific DNA recombinase
MYSILQPPLVARNGHTLEVLITCRVSSPGPGKQDIRSNDDQEAMHRKWLSEYTNLPYQVTVLAGSGSGESLERNEYPQLRNHVESNRFDLLLTEDLGRIVRRMHAHLFCELCVDHGVRLIALNDVVDTAQEGWQDRSIFSAWHHERSNRDTSQRIKRTHRSRFIQGGCASLPIFGYRKGDGAKSDADWERVLEAETIYREWFDRLDRGMSYAEIADWLNESGISPGPYCRLKRWDCAMVTRITHNWILKGLRFRNKRKTRRNNASGIYKSEKADPSELLTRSVPDLAFFDAAYYDRVVAKADTRNAKYRRNGKGEVDPCANRSRKRVRFPGQIIDCGICGRQFVFGGHGQKDHLMCEGARQHRCWNGLTVDGPLATQKITDAVFAQIELLQDFNPEFMARVNAEVLKQDSDRELCLQELSAKIANVEREIANMIKFIRGGDESQSVRIELHQLEEQQRQWQYTRDELEKTPSRAIVMPTAYQIKQLAHEAFRDLIRDSYEFGMCLRSLTGRIVVRPVRSIDGGHIGLRAEFRLRLANLVSDQRLYKALQRPLESALTLDLFDSPQRIAFREQIRELRRTKTEHAAAQELGITVTAAQRAAALDRLMQQQGRSDPYVLLTEPPCDYGKLRRHLHPRYCFEPLPDHHPDW